MAKFSLIKGFKNPVTRPRFIIWTGVVVLMLAAVVVCALGITSTYWFCAEGCHKVQDDTITAYNKSTHSKISCMACHMPVNADPITFVLHKMKALGELYLTVTDNFELPLNPESHLSLSYEMQSDKCTQCHNMANREVTPSEGIIISHEAHEKAKPTAAAEEEYWNEIQCTWCHNRIAHNEEGWDLALKDPKTGANHKHESYMSMDACFRCHTQTDESMSLFKGPGTCSVCHPKDFELKPANHDPKDFVTKQHAEMAMEKKSEAATALAEFEKREAEAKSAEEKAPLPPVEAVFYCTTCHNETKFCTNCHGMEMPHSTEFKDKKHPEVAKAKFDKCVMCHQPAKTFFCDKCHHGTKVGWEFDTKAAWGTQHAKAVTAKGIDGCLTACHDKKFCYDCHTKKKPFPTSHKDKTWLHGTLTVSKYGSEAAKPTAKHAVNAQQQPVACEICHGAGGPNAAFCKSCHKYEMPHPAEFKKFHSATGKKDPNQCKVCHQFNEICSNCHHAGASTNRAWTAVHGGVVNTSGAGGCLEKCHKADFCVKCHTTRKVVPASHKAGTWTRDMALGKTAIHAATFTKAGDSCTYCHGANEPNGNTFCKGCHKLEMPHPSGFGPAQGAKPAVGAGGQHETQLRDKKISNTVCTNCHNTAFCNNCHHGYTGSTPWVNAHPNTVKKDGTEACFNCHKETYCSYCHVRRAQEFIKR